MMHPNEIPIEEPKHVAELRWEAVALDGLHDRTPTYEGGGHVHALTVQINRQVMARYLDRQTEREIKP